MCVCELAWMFACVRACVYLCEGARVSARECVRTHVCVSLCAPPAPPRPAPLGRPAPSRRTRRAGPGRTEPSRDTGGCRGRGAGRVRGWSRSVPERGLCAAVEGGLPVLVPGGSRRGSCPLWHRRAGVGVGTGVSWARSARVGTEGPSCCRCRPPLTRPPVPAESEPRESAPGVCPGRSAMRAGGRPPCPGTARAGSSRRGCPSPACPAPHPGASVNAISADRLRAGTPGSRTRHCAQPGPVCCPLPAPASLEGAALPAGTPIHAMDM